jgi:hypothetical protein
LKHQECGKSGRAAVLTSDVDDREKLVPDTIVVKRYDAVLRS